MSTNMRIGIVSMLSDNYGALLQSYALQTILERMECKVVLVNRRWKSFREKTTFRQKLYGLKNRLFHNESAFERFRRKRLNLTSIIRSYKDLERLNEQLDLVITGSDQVWHDGCSKVMDGYFFLDWVRYPIVNRCSYAASFGKDTFDGRKDEIALFSSILSTYKGISVRENTGLNICKRVFGVEAEWHLDPTLLLSSDDYNKILPPCCNQNIICSYMLDKSTGKTNLVEKVSIMLNCGIVHNLVEKHSISVEQWVQNIRDSKYVITDSFHGMVFSIIFGKQFVCINNKKRGSTRFSCLLNYLNLSNRLIDVESVDEDKVIQLLCTPIEYPKVREKLEVLRIKSMVYLKKMVSNGK